MWRLPTGPSGCLQVVVAREAVIAAAQQAKAVGVDGLNGVAAAVEADALAVRWCRTPPVTTVCRVHTHARHTGDQARWYSFRFRFAARSQSGLRLTLHDCSDASCFQVTPGAILFHGRWCRCVPAVTTVNNTGVT